MKNKRLLLVVLTLIGVMLLLPATALAGDIFRFRGDSADAYFFEVDSTECIFTDVYVFASEGINQSPPGPPGNSSGADIWISQYDSCNYIQLMAASGSASLASPDFQVQKNLNSATLNTTINVYDYVNDTSFDVVVDLDWIGSGALSRGSSQSKYQSGSCKSHSRWQGSWRFATASGSVTVGETNFTSLPSIYSNLQAVKSGDMVIGCN